MRPRSQGASGDNPYVQEFEKVLHPIFEEDEMTLIIAGGVLGAVAGYIQQITTVPSESQQREQLARAAARDSNATGQGGDKKAVPEEFRE